MGRSVTRRTYVFWNAHASKPGLWDFEYHKNLTLFLDKVWRSRGRVPSIKRDSVPLPRPPILTRAGLGERLLRQLSRRALRLRRVAVWRLPAVSHVRASNWCTHSPQRYITGPRTRILIYPAPIVLLCSDVPGLQTRSANAPWEQLAGDFFLRIVEQYRGYFADRGGPIVLAQVRGGARLGALAGGKQRAAATSNTARHLHRSIPTCHRWRTSSATATPTTSTGARSSSTTP
jgi:hypothetical protein